MSTSVLDDAIELETIQCGSQVAVHNNRLWSVKENRHPETSGRAWGWIDGPAEHICWSNNSDAFNVGKAVEVCRIHNSWVENQKSIDLRLNERGTKTRALKSQWLKVRQAADAAWEEYQQSLSLLRDL